MAFKPLVPLRGQPAGDVVGGNEGEVGARRRGALVGSSLGCVLAGSVQRTGGLKATLHSSCRRRGGRAAWGGVRCGGDRKEYRKHGSFGFFVKGDRAKTKMTPFFWFPITTIFTAIPWLVL